MSGGAGGNAKIEALARLHNLSQWRGGNTQGKNGLGNGNRTGERAGRVE